MSEINVEPELSIIVPCYNEADNIPRLVADFARCVKNRPDIELILVDNGSVDGTGATLKEEVSKTGLANARVVTVAKNIGYGFGILSGLEQASGKLLSWTHADLQTDPEDVLRAYDIYKENSGKVPGLFVKGHRKNRKAAEMFFSWAMQIIASAALGCPVQEINAQPKLFPRTFYETMTDPPYDFSLDLYVLYLARKSDYKILSLPVYFKKRLHGEAKGGSGSSWKVRWGLIRRTFQYIFELREKLKAKE